MATARRPDPIVELGFLRIPDPRAERGIREALCAAAALGGAPDVPPLLARLARVEEGGGLDAPGGWLALAEAIADALLDFPIDPGDWDGLDARALLAYAEDNLDRRARVLAREAACPLVADRDRVLREARGATAAWDWTRETPKDRTAVIALGALRLRVTFRRSPDGSWSQGWGGDGDTLVLLAHLDRLALSGRPVATGLFGTIDAAIAEIDRDFLETVGPDSLRVDGLDAVRNAHNLRTYAGHAPDGYALEPILSADPTRATPGGVSGVRFVRIPEPTMGGP